MFLLQVFKIIGYNYITFIQNIETLVTGQQSMDVRRMKVAVYHVIVVLQV